MINHLWKKTFYVLLILLVSCTSSQDKLSTDSVNLHSSYKLPLTYQQHRSQQKYFQSKYGSVAYTDHGTGKVLVLLHGVPTSSWMYRKIIPSLQTDFRVISIDFLGYGSSSKPKDNGVNYSAISQAENVEALLVSLGIHKYSLLMHDMGGLVAWELLRMQPNTISNLIILNTIVNQNGFEHPDIKPGAMTKLMTKAYSNNLTSAAALKMTFNNLGLGGDYKLSEAECNGYVTPMKEGGDKALYVFYTGLNNDLYKRLNNNKAVFQSFEGNTLVLWGAKDKTLTTKQIPFLREHLHIPAKNIHIYEENNHFLVEEIPEEVISKVRKILADK